eukprot:COSAG06_NODE_13771_length_1221_cov_1.540107_2_plen_71_part_00
MAWPAASLVGVVVAFRLIMQGRVLDELGGLLDVLRNAGGLQATAGLDGAVRISDLPLEWMDLFTKELAPM